MSRQHLTVALWTVAVSGGTLVAQADAGLEVARAIQRAAAPASDDVDANVRDALAAARRTAAHPASAMLVALARWRAAELADPQQYLDQLAGIRAAAPHGITDQEALEAIGETLRRLGRDAEARQLDPGTRHAQALLAIGPFGDAGDYYQGVPFPPEYRFPKAKEALPGRTGEVRSRVVRRTPPRMLVDLAEIGGERLGCFYGLHQVEAARATPCYVEVECNGSFELFVNGEPRRSLNRVARSIGVLDRVPATLRKGRNHVLIKTTNDERCEVALRYLDAAGRPLADVTEAADPEAVLPPAPAADAPEPPPPFTGMLESLAAALATAGPADGGTLRTAIAWIAREINHEEALLDYLQQSEAQPPTEPRDALVLARTLVACERLPADLRRARARALVEGPGKPLADEFGAVLLRLSFLEDEDRLEDAIRLLGKRVADHQAGPETWRRLHELQRRLRFDGEARRTRLAWSKARPQDGYPVVVEAQERNRAGDQRGAWALLRGLAERRPGDLTVARPLLEVSLDLGEAETALAVLARLQQEETQPLRALEQRANALERLGKRAEAAEAWHELGTRAVRGELLERCGDALDRLGRNETALALYRRALELDPGRHAVRRLLGRLAAGGEGPAEDFPASAAFRRDAEAAVREFAPSARDSSAPSTLVIDQMVVEVFADGSQIETTHQLRRINDQKGVEQHQDADRAARAGELIRLRTVTPDGKSWVPNRISGNFSMPRLAPGCFVDEEHRSFREATRPGPLRTTEFHFRSADEPFVLSEFVVILPKDVGGSWRLRNFAGARETRTLADGRVAHVLRMNDQSRLPVERRRPPDGDLLPVATFGEDGGSEAESRGDHVSMLWRTRSSGYVAQQARALTAEIAGDTARAQAIHRFVHDSIPSGEGRPDPTHLLLQKKGPRFFLEAALLAEAGVPLRLACTRSTSEAFDDAAVPLFAGVDRYEEPAVRVEPRDGPAFWLFADSPRHLPLGMIPAARLGAPAVLLDEGRRTLVRLPGGNPSELLGTTIQGRLTLDQDGNATLAADAALRGETGYQGAEAVRMQEGDVQKVIARQVAGQIFRGWTQKSAQLTGIERPGTPLSIQALLTKSQALKPLGEDFLLSLPFETRMIQQWGDRAERTLPYRIHDPDAISWEITLVTGPNWQVVEAPPNAQERLLLLDYAFTTRRVPEGLVLRTDLRILPGEIPATQFGAWLDLLRKLDQRAEGTIRLARRAG